MEETLEYQKLTLMVANFSFDTKERPFHIANSTKISLGSLGALFKPIDDDSLSIIPNAQIVGATLSRSAQGRDSAASHDSSEFLDSLMIVI